MAKVFVALGMFTLVASSFGCTDSQSGGSGFCESAHGFPVPAVASLEGYELSVEIESGSGVLCSVAGTKATGSFAASTYSVSDQGAGPNCDGTETGEYTYAHHGFLGTLTIMPNGDEADSGTLEFCGKDEALGFRNPIECYYRLTVSKAGVTVGEQRGNCALLNPEG